MPAAPPPRGPGPLPTCSRESALVDAAPRRDRLLRRALAVQLGPGGPMLPLSALKALVARLAAPLVSVAVGGLAQDTAPTRQGFRGTGVFRPASGRGARGHLHLVLAPTGELALVHAPAGAEDRSLAQSASSPAPANHCVEVLAAATLWSSEAGRAPVALTEEEFGVAWLEPEDPSGRSFELRLPHLLPPQLQLQAAAAPVSSVKRRQFYCRENVGQAKAKLAEIADLLGGDRPPVAEVLGLDPATLVALAPLAASLTAELAQVGAERLAREREVAEASAKAALARRRREAQSAIAPHYRQFKPLVRQRVVPKRRPGLRAGFLTAGAGRRAPTDPHIQPRRTQARVEQTADDGKREFKEAAEPVEAANAARPLEAEERPARLASHVQEEVRSEPQAVHVEGSIGTQGDEARKAPVPAAVAPAPAAIPAETGEAEAAPAGSGAGGSGAGGPRRAERAVPDGPGTPRVESGAVTVNNLRGLFAAEGGRREAAADGAAQEAAGGPAGPKNAAVSIANLQDLFR